MIRSHLKSLAGPALISILWVGPALATDRDDPDASQQTLRPGTSDSSGKKGAERRINQTLDHPRIINSSVHNLEHAHFNANQMLHVSNPEAESDAKDSGKASTGVSNRTNVQRGEALVMAAGFAGAKAGVVSPMQASAGERSKRSPGESEHSGPSDAGDDDMSSSSGDKSVKQNVRTARNTVIPNDFSSAHSQLEKNGKLGLDKAQAAHFSANVAQQVSGGDDGENGGKTTSFNDKTVVSHDPQMGTHNNFHEVRERSMASSVVDRIAKVHTPEKMFH